MQFVLFSHLGLERHLYHPCGGGVLISQKFKTAGGKFSTSEDVLRHLCAHERCFVPLVMEYRKLAKLTQTYFSGVLAKENLFPFFDVGDETSAASGAAVMDVSSAGLGKGAGGTAAAGSSGTLCCVHANFNQGTTDTGRLSCIDPNIQNLPRCQNSSSNKSQQQGSGGSPSTHFLLAPLSGGPPATSTTSANGTPSLPSSLSPSALSGGSNGSGNGPSDGGENTTYSSSLTDMALATAVRSSFVARPRHTLVAIDYEQIELRVLAHLSQDPKLLRVLCSDDAAEKDIHKRIAAEVFGKPAALITPDERTQAKRVVFGTLYGAGPGAFAAELGITEERARAIQNFFWRAFPSIDKYQKEVLGKCRQTREVRTIVGRLRKIPEIATAPYGSPARAAAERQAFNTCVQGSAADIVKKAMAHVFTEVLCRNYATEADPRRTSTSSSSDVGAGGDGRALLLAQIHDELVFSVPTKYLSRIVPDLRRAMTGCFSLLVPLKVSVKHGPSLGALADWCVDAEIGLLDE